MSKEHASKGRCWSSHAALRVSNNWRFVRALLWKWPYWLRNSAPYFIALPKDGSHVLNFVGGLLRNENQSIPFPRFRSMMCCVHMLTRES